MATGFTYKIIENDISFKEFATNCSAAFSHHHEGLPKEIEINDYHLTATIKAVAKYNDLKLFTSDQKIDHVYKIIQQTKENSRRNLNEIQTENLKLNNMLVKVKKWKGPKNLKNFMIQQLTDSLTDESYYVILNQELDFKTDKNYIQYFNQNILAPVKQDITYHKKHYRQEVKRAEKTNKYLKQLWAAIEGIND